MNVAPDAPIGMTLLTSGRASTPAAFRRVTMSSRTFTLNAISLPNGPPPAPVWAE